MKVLALAAITFYWRFLSPWKGFSCAYRVRTGNASCSALDVRTVRRYSVRRGFDVLRGRLERCDDAYRKHRVINRVREAGHCDIPDVPCDHGGWDCLGSVGDAVSCFDLPCDGGGWRGSKRKSEGDKNASLTPCAAFSFALGNLWRIAIEYPGSPVPPWPDGRGCPVLELVGGWMMKAGWRSRSIRFNL